MPDEKFRKVCLSLFLQSINQANSYGSNKWGVHYRRDGIRLLVGSLIVFTIHKNGIWLALDKQLLNERKDTRESLGINKLWQWDDGKWSEYKAVPSMNGYYTPSSENLEIWPIIRDFHFEYVKKVANKYEWLNIKSQSKSTPELLTYLEKELGQSIPVPKYGIQEDKILQDDNILQEIKDYNITHKELSETEREAIVQSRIGQGIFRSDLKKYWGEKCAVTGCKLIKILKASHIKPWSHSNNTERLDLYNGLLLIPNLDSVFDKGYISFDDEGKIIISNLLSEDDRIKLDIHSEMRIRKIEEKHIKYLEYHKQEIFLK
ncbi:hypothetical protein EO98_15790 [Methanosarcina sp. 2.H.T.1A.6]|uniref:HNH endonuclease n=1 Tax=unclassified Methanosarcina TaxID=2644672 RepID=UPI00062202ED|nr:MULTISPECIES: HNH endonuclease [unclassified Methanosarcina]KKG11732.1 hypothetical protein EO97_11290 [Methanosarcina sp. 2.H.T.1A.15]KKG17626.1 hypothetical protein EO94_12215 [Methanosarcina sp. 2.H.T.1A.3]KKG21866.1 hypothetical protein EO98_15790 [Methanosarcina sp. 2.H.T.1A.6]KKG25402.1 hypothetical protein EO96_00240 [Methanosarcina sp. 2.H.T.1A.8]